VLLLDVPGLEVLVLGVFGLDVQGLGALVSGGCLKMVEAS
jgi:hypothetical protein